MHHELVDATYVEEGCSSDSTIVGGPFDHSGPSYTTHFVYADKPDTCYDAPVCEAHLAWTLMFMGNEHSSDYYTRAYLEARVEPLHGKVAER